MLGECNNMVTDIYVLNVSIMGNKVKSETRLLPHGYTYYSSSGLVVCYFCAQSQIVGRDSKSA